jgi:hypothetical protein
MSSSPRDLGLHPVHLPSLADAIDEHEGRLGQTADTKVCVDCKLPKSIEEFQHNRSGGRIDICRECMRGRMAAGVEASGRVAHPAPVDRREIDRQPKPGSDSGASTAVAKPEPKPRPPVDQATVDRLLREREAQLAEERLKEKRLKWEEETREAASSAAASRLSEQPEPEAEPFPGRPGPPAGLPIENSVKLEVKEDGSVVGPPLPDGAIVRVEGDPAEHVYEVTPEMAAMAAELVDPDDWASAVEVRLDKLEFRFKHLEAAEWTMFEIRLGQYFDLLVGIARGLDGEAAWPICDRIEKLLDRMQEREA